jgi:hypothetical protein
LTAKTVTAPGKSPGTASATRAGEESAPLRRRRRVPGWTVALVGMAAAVGFGVGVEKLPFGPPMVMVALGGMTLALCGLALWRVIDPLTRDEANAGREARGPGRARELEREKQAVLKAIKEIELDHQMRKIADVDYREMIERYRTRAMRLISEIEAGDNFRELIERELKDRLVAEPVARAAATEAMATEATATTTTTTTTTTETTAAPTITTTSTTKDEGCAACGTINDSDAQFCKKCGVKLAA